jgi:hypothetical protein
MAEAGRSQPRLMMLPGRRSCSGDESWKMMLLIPSGSSTVFDAQRNMVAHFSQLARARVWVYHVTRKWSRDHATALGRIPKRNGLSSPKLVVSRRS